MCSTVTNADKIKEIDREIGMRLSAYPRWVAMGRMKQEAADRRLDILRAIRQDYADKEPNLFSDGKS